MINIGVIGDFKEDRRSHQAVNDALNHAVDSLSLKLNIRWLPTQSLEQPNYHKTLERFDGFWGAPGSPYISLDGALRGIRFVRELGRPFLGTCGGFQHAVLEYAQNVLGIKATGHAEYDSNISNPVITLVSCPVIERPEGTPMLWGTLRIRLTPNSLAFRIYKQTEIEEEFNCNYELNPAFRDPLEAKGLSVTGIGENDEARIVELSDHRFFMATAFQPQLTSEAGRPHPLIIAYLQAILDFQKI